MANTLRNTGFRPWGTPLRVNNYTSNGIVYPGDAVQLASTGQVAAWSSSAVSTLGVAGSYSSAQGQQLTVFDHPDQLFVGQVDGAFASPNNLIGMNATISATSGSTTYKVSRMQVATTAIGTTAAFPLKILAVDNRPDNSFGTYADVIVQINNHTLKGGTGTLGI